VSCPVLSCPALPLPFPSHNRYVLTRCWVTTTSRQRSVVRASTTGYNKKRKKKNEGAITRDEWGRKLAAHSRASLAVSFFAFGFANVVVVVVMVNSATKVHAVFDCATSDTNEKAGWFVRAKPRSAGNRTAPVSSESCTTDAWWAIFSLFFWVGGGVFFVM
jgi:hypothetical protein